MNETAASKPNARQPESDWEYLAIGAILIAGIVLLLIFVGVSQSSTYGIKDLGPVGDWFGGLLNPLIAFLALTGLVRSVSIQRETLRSTAAGLKDQFELQRRQLSRQTFFDLLTLRANSVNSVEWLSDGRTVNGRAAVKAILQTISTVAGGIAAEDISEELERWEVPLECPEAAKSYVAVFAAFYSRDPSSFTTAWFQAVLEEEGQLSSLEAELGHVFRATYQVLKFVYECPDFDFKEKKDLVNYLRAQMSEGEFALFALTAVTSIGEKSRAASITFDFYEDRLFSISWARELVKLFDPRHFPNILFAEKMGYAVPSERY